MTLEPGDIISVTASMARPALCLVASPFGDDPPPLLERAAGLWPALMEHYSIATASGLFAPGGFLAFTTGKGGLVFILAATGDPLRAKEVAVECFEAMSRYALSLGVTEVSFPALGTKELSFPALEKIISRVDTGPRFSLRVVPSQ